MRCRVGHSPPVLAVKSSLHRVGKNSTRLSRRQELRDIFTISLMIFCTPYALYTCTIRLIVTFAGPVGTLACARTELVGRNAHRVT